MRKINRKSETNARALRLKIMDELYPPYWDEGMSFHKSRGKQTRKKWRKEITHYEYRMYRTWKYNRKTKWKKQ